MSSPSAIPACYFKAVFHDQTDDQLNTTTHSSTDTSGLCNGHKFCPTHVSLSGLSSLDINECFDQRKKTEDCLNSIRINAIKLLETASREDLDAALSNHEKIIENLSKRINNAITWP